MKYDIEDLPDSRGVKTKYPWDVLKTIGSCFVWDNIDDRKSISSSATYHKMKVSCRQKDGKLHVIRVK